MESSNATRSKIGVGLNTRKNSNPTATPSTSPPRLSIALAYTTLATPPVNNALVATSTSPSTSPPPSPLESCPIPAAGCTPSIKPGAPLNNTCRRATNLAAYNNSIRKYSTHSRASPLHIRIPVCISDLATVALWLCSSSQAAACTHTAASVGNNCIIRVSTLDICLLLLHDPQNLIHSLHSVKSPLNFRNIRSYNLCVRRMIQ